MRHDESGDSEDGEDELPCVTGGEREANTQHSLTEDSNDIGLLNNARKYKLLTQEGRRRKMLFNM